MATVKQAAKILHKSDRTVQRYAQEGTLYAVKVKRKWDIRDSAIKGRSKDRTLPKHNLPALQGPEKEKPYAEKVREAYRQHMQAFISNPANSKHAQEAYSEAYHALTTIKTTRTWIADYRQY